jgi:TRAP-type C4-dicarboxylate transport system permease small subunit
MSGRLYRVLDAGVRPIEVAAAIFGSAMMLGCMLLTSVDVVARYLLDAPLWFNQYLTENYLMVGLMTLPLAWGFRSGGYIRVVGMVQAMPSALGQFLLRAGLLAGGVYVAALAWFSGIRWWEAFEDGSVDMGVIDWPVSWSWIWVPIGLGLFALRLALMSIGPARELHFDETVISEDGV